MYKRWTILVHRLHFGAVFSYKLAGLLARAVKTRLATLKYPLLKTLQKLIYAVLFVVLTVQTLVKLVWRKSINSQSRLTTKSHTYLSDKFRLYNRYHSSRLHRFVNFGVLAVYLLAVSGLLIVNIAPTFASDNYTQWDFSNINEYTLDDGVEIVGNTVRLKAQNYQDDEYTGALYHLDELAGPSVTDSSSYENDGSATGGSFGQGHLNNSYTLNGQGDAISAPDGEGNSLGQNHTIEAWTQLEEELTPGSLEHRQNIVDKGDYSLYYDNESAKLTYEIANENYGTWVEAGGNDVNGSWDQNGKRAVNATTTIGSDLYAGLGIDNADAEVWRWNGTSWSMIGGDGINDSWPDQTFEYVYSLGTDGTNLYAGLGSGAGDAEVWSWDGTTWTKIGGDGVNGGWAINTFELVAALSHYDGKLYAGLGSGANDAEVWSWDGTTWTKIGGDSLNSGWTTNFELVSALANDGTNLYAALGTSANDAEVWRWNGSAWTKIGGDSLNSGWTTNFESVRSLAWSSGNLYAGLGDSAADAEVWRWNGSAWTKIGGDGVNSSWDTDYEYVMSVSVIGGTVYAGLGSGNGDGEVWAFASGSWTKIGGDGVNGGWAAALGDVIYSLSPNGSNLYAGTYDSAGSGFVYEWDGTSWTQIGGQYVNDSWGYYGQGSVEVMFSARGNMYAGLGSGAGSAQVWRWSGSSWQMIGGQGTNNSWAANTYELVTSMTSYAGNLVVGLGSSANDAEVWSWDGTTWTKIGGDGVNGGWTANYEEVNALASFGDRLYAGLGNSGNDGEVWEWDGTVWTKIGGDGVNGGWTGNYERAAALALYKGELVVGLGASAGDSEVWRWNGSNWAKIGGDTLNSSWGADIEQVESMIAYNGKLYAGLGNQADDGEVWEWDGTVWTKIGGDEVNGSWLSATYERARGLTVYNGQLYVGLGSSAGDGEVWRWDTAGNWEKVAGNNVNGSWANTMEEVESFTVYEGKIYAGTGNTANTDTIVWQWGNNGFLQSELEEFDTDWRHVAATYDGSTMKLFIDGELESSTDKTLNVASGSTRPLLIGQGYAGREQSKPQSNFRGKLDEVRLSTVARSEFNTIPYSASPQTLSLATSSLVVGNREFDNFETVEATDGGSINYRLSNDDGSTWLYWDGSDWVTSNDLAQANSVSVIDDNIVDFPLSLYGLKWQAILDGDGTQRPAVQTVTIGSNSDVEDPDVNATNIRARKSADGANLESNDWTNGSSPYFSWDAAEDTGAGILGYCVYLGSDNTADPVSTKGLLGSSPEYSANLCQYLVAETSIDLGGPGSFNTPLTTSTDPYYLRIKAIDRAGNIVGDSAQFQFRFDNTPPTNPGYITAPSGFINSKETTLTWPVFGAQAASDTGSGLAGLQYRINNTAWYGDNHDGSGDIDDLLTNDGNYTTVPTPDFVNINEGVNTIYFRAWDQAGNVTSTYTTATLKVNTAGAPSEPQNLIASPSYNTTNSFSFSWGPPVTFVGDESNITYCYTVNVLPSLGSCSFTSAGVTALNAGAYATQPGENTLYLAAKDESGNINYATYTTVAFTADTPAPGIPQAMDILDASVKATSKWRLAITWEEPSDTGSGISSYRIYRSTDNSNFSFVGSSSSTTYIDANLSQTTYYYYVRACDNTNNCGAPGASVNMLPTGKFTEPADLTSQPQVSNITTKKASVGWTTDRSSDSKISIGTRSGQYSSSEIGNSDQVTAHTLELDNLAAGTTYYLVAKWTDEDGNTGSSQEFVFTTSPAPVIKEIENLEVGLSTSTIKFTVKGAHKVNLYFGLSDSFGGLKSINTSFDESEYTFSLDGLNDGAKYYYRLSAFDSEGSEYLGNVFSFTTPPRPRIANLRFQPVEGEPTSTQLVSWTTNVASTSMVTYGLVGTAGTSLQNSEPKTEHEIKISNLQDDSMYFIVAQSRDASGNLAVSDRQQFRTALDTRPPKIYDITIESSIRGTGAEARGQVIVSWKTDEVSKSQVGYAEGSSATVFNSKTAEDGSLTTEHIVIVSDLPTSKVYSIQPISRDRADNTGTGEPQSAIIGRASENVLTIVINTLQKVFGF